MMQCFRILLLWVFINIPKKLNYSFGEIISIIASISTFTIDSIKDEFNIEIESLIESYVSEINNFLNNYFLEEMKDEYFKGK